MIIALSVWSVAAAHTLIAFQWIFSFVVGPNATLKSTKQKESKKKQHKTNTTNRKFKLKIFINDATKITQYHESMCYCSNRFV